ncbi:hypothetical protein [Streptomyces sp. NPDC005548]|uniref:hypothetical protein n=1 Tax=Streptomyces sp. NPDC005548 TaxID=3364724 RepID=UPI0036B94B6A
MAGRDHRTICLRLPHRLQLTLARGLQAKDAVEQPLLRRRQLVPPDPLRDRPSPEVLTLQDHLARLPRHTGTPADRRYPSAR